MAHDDRFIPHSPRQRIRLLPRLAATGTLTALMLVAAVHLMSAPRDLHAATPPLAVCVVVDVSSSNWEPSDNYHASDPGPVYARVELFHLMADLLGADTGERQVLLGFTAFGTDVTDQSSLVDVRTDADRQALIGSFEQAIRPQAWTSTDLGVAACIRQLQAAPAGARLRIELLSDGRPERPGADAARQLATIINQQLPDFVARGGVLDTVLYGDAAANAADPAADVMQRLADTGHGKRSLAPHGFDLLQVAVGVTAGMLDLPVASGPSTRSIETTITPFDIPVGTSYEWLSLVVVRSSADLSVAITAPNGTTIASTAGGPGTISAHSLVRTLDAPVPGHYQVVVKGTGEFIVSSIARTTVVVAATPVPTPSAAPAVSPSPAPVTTPVSTSAPAATVLPVAPAGVAPETPASPAASPSATVGPLPEPQPKQRDSGGLPLLPLLAGLSTLAAIGFLAVLARRRPSAAPIPARSDVLLGWSDGVHRTTALAGLPALQLEGGSVALAALLVDAPAAVDGWAVTRRGAALELSGGTERTTLLPGLTAAAPLPEGVSLTWCTGEPTDTEVEQARPTPSLPLSPEPEPAASATILPVAAGVAPIEPAQPAPGAPPAAVPIPGLPGLPQSGGGRTAMAATPAPRLPETPVGGPTAPIAGGARPEARLPGSPAARGRPPGRR